MEKQFATEGATVVHEIARPSSAPSWNSEMNKWEQVVKEGGIKAE